MKVFRSPRARRSPDARAAPTLRRDLRHAPLKRPCSRPGSYQRSSGVPVPGDNTPRIIDDRAGKSYRNRRPGPDHRGLPNMVMGRLSLLSSISYTNELAALKCQSVRNCGILVVIGGSLYIQPIWKHSLFTTVFSLRDVLQRKRLYSSADKTFVLGTNFGPYRNSWYKKSYSDIFNKYVTDICFRDQYSFQLFKSDEHIRVAPDILFGTEFPRVERKKKVLFSVVDLGNTMKFRDLSSCSADYDSWIVNAANCYANLGYDIQLCGFSTVEHDDVAVARISHLLAQESIQHDCLTYDNDTSRILSAIAESEVIVGTRFHASILGLAAGCKVLPIIYSDKTSHSLDDIGFASDIRLDLRNFKSDDISICRKVLARERVDIGEVKTQSQRHFIGLDCVLGVGR